MPTVQQLRYLVAVADTLNFSRAAQACNVTQPTLSMQLKEMEARLDAQLVERTRARVILTPVGEEIARRARTVLAEVEDIRQIARRDDPSRLKGTVRMGVVQTVGAYVLSLAMPRIRETFPELRINVREDSLEGLPRKLSDGTHDVLLMPDAREFADCTRVRLMREPLHLVLPSDHRLASFDAIDPAQLRGETILSMDHGQQLHDQIARLCHDVGAIDVQDYSGTTLDTLRQMVAAGMGLSLLPALYVRSDVLREKLVVARPLTHGAPVRDLTMLWRTSSPRQAVFQALADTISDCIAPWRQDE
jgi:LysR family transcriptional regulator, hydrogen peroxide-inducible genes activator